MMILFIVLEFCLRKEIFKAYVCVIHHFYITSFHSTGNLGRDVSKGFVALCAVDILEGVVNFTNTTLLF